AWAVASATGKVSGSDLDWVKAEANALYRVLSGLFEQAHQVIPDVRVADRLKTSWTQLLCTLNFPPPTDQNLGQCLGAVNSWVVQAGNALGQLRSAALDQLLVTEGEVARHFQEGTIPAASPAPSVTPGRYRTLVPGDERRIDQKLSWWARFQTASGVL